MQNRPIVVVLSGGQDSTTVLYWAKQQGFAPIYAISFDYGQRHNKELLAAAKIGEMAGVQEHILAAGGFTMLMSDYMGEGLPETREPTGLLRGTSPLVDKTQEVEKYASAEVLPGGLEKTFVPCRNLLFMVVAANYALSVGAKDIALGICQEDYGGYPDCREAFRDRAQAAINEALYGDVAGGFHIHAPLMMMTKKDSVMLANRLDGCMAALAYSHTCYDGEYPPNPHNHASLLRAKGFKEAQLPDPLIVRAKGESLLPKDYPDDGYVDGTSFASVPVTNEQAKEITEEPPVKVKKSKRSETAGE